MNIEERNNTIREMQSIYHPADIAKIGCLIRELADTHCMYGKHMRLCYGKACGIRDVLDIFYHATVTLEYVWLVLEDFQNEPKS